jgi:hypothetical protein
MTAATTTTTTATATATVPRLVAQHSAAAHGLSFYLSVCLSACQPRAPRAMYIAVRGGGWSSKV